MLFLVLLLVWVLVPSSLANGNTVWGIKDSIPLPVDSQIRIQRSLLVLPNLNVTFNNLSTLKKKVNGIISTDIGTQYNDIFLEVFTPYGDSLVNGITGIETFLQNFQKTDVNVGYIRDGSCNNTISMLDVNLLNNEITMMTAKANFLATASVQQDVDNGKLFRNEVELTCSQIYQTTIELEETLKIELEIIENLKASRLHETLIDRLKGCNLKSSTVGLLGAKGKLLQDGIHISLETNWITHRQTEVYIPISYVNHFSLGYPTTDYILASEGDYYSLTCSTKCNIKEFSPECSKALEKGNCDQLVKYCPLRNAPAPFVITNNLVIIHSPKVKVIHTANDRVTIINAKVPYYFTGKGNVQLEMFNMVTNKIFETHDKIVPISINETVSKCQKAIFLLSKVANWYDLTGQDIFSGSIGSLMIIGALVVIGGCYKIILFGCKIHRRLNRALERNRSTVDLTDRVVFNPRSQTLQLSPRRSDDYV